MYHFLSYFLFLLITVPPFDMLNVSRCETGSQSRSVIAAQVCACEKMSRDAKSYDRLCLASTFIRFN